MATSQSSAVGWESEVVKRVAAEIETVPAIADLKLIRPKVFPDERGFFSETYNVEEWREKLNFTETFKQDNHSFSKYGVVRGLHTQPGMGKLVSVLSGAIFDVAVDVRPGSASYGKWHSVVLDAKTKTNFWIPAGFLHGFQCISEGGAHVVYKCTAVYAPDEEYGVNPFDADIGVQWPIADREKMIVSKRDQKHPNLSEIAK